MPSWLYFLRIPKLYAPPESCVSAQGDRCERLLDLLGGAHCAACLRGSHVRYEARALSCSKLASQRPIRGLHSSVWVAYLASFLFSSLSSSSLLILCLLLSCLPVAETLSPSCLASSPLTQHCLLAHCCSCSVYWISAKISSYWTLHLYMYEFNK